eukprot:364877-Chlamydomonas_euryale.AAC.2
MTRWEYQGVGEWRWGPAGDGGGGGTLSWGYGSSDLTRKPLNSSALTAPLTATASLRTLCSLCPSLPLSTPPVTTPLSACSSSLVLLRLPLRLPPPLPSHLSDSGPPLRSGEREGSNTAPCVPPSAGRAMAYFTLG